jgi:hypothetical protein
LTNQNILWLTGGSVIVSQNQRIEIENREKEIGLRESKRTEMEDQEME